MPKVRKPVKYQIVNGVRVPPKMLKECIEEAFEYKPSPDDTIISTYPKCGTTWMQMIVIQIFRKGQPLEKPTDFMVTSPFLEMLGLEGINRMPRPGLIKTHLSYDKMPFSTEAKYIFVVRNPLDTCVSLYHHTYMKPGFESWDGTFDDFFELFIDGEVEFNDYFDHLLSWYPHKDDKNVYWTTYEIMKKDLRSVVFGLAKFLGDEYFDLIKNDNKLMNNIIQHSDFSYMKDMYSKIEESRKFGPDPDTPKGLRYLCVAPEDNVVSKTAPHVRKGVVGDWKNYFSYEQYLRMKKKFELKTSGTDIGMLWPDLFVEE